MLWPSLNSGLLRDSSVSSQGVSEFRLGHSIAVLTGGFIDFLAFLSGLGVIVNCLEIIAGSCYEFETLLATGVYFLQLNCELANV